MTTTTIRFSGDKRPDQQSITNKIKFAVDRGTRTLTAVEASWHNEFVAAHKDPATKLWLTSGNMANIDVEDLSVQLNLPTQRKNAK